MDSPKTTTTTATATSTSTAAASVTTLSDSPPVQESPFSNYVSNLSPIKPVKHSHVGQGILGLNSPPLVFTSPRTISDRQTNFLRFQCSQTSGVEVSKNGDGSQKSTDGLDDLGNSDACFSGRRTADAQKSSDAKNSLQDQPGSSSGCVDEYLADPVEADCADSVNLANPNVRFSGGEVQLSESGLTNLTKDALKLDDRNHESTQANGCQEMSEKVGADPQEQSMFETMTTKVEGEQANSKPFKGRPNFEPDFHMDDASRKQCDVLGPQVLPLDVNFGEDVGTVLHGPVQITHHGSKASQLLRGMSKRCLQFEEAQQKTTLDGTISSNVTCSISPASPVEVEILDASHAESTISSSKKQSMITNNSGKSPLTVSKPSGIGLHLNSIVNALPMDSAAARIKLDSIMSHQVLENKTSCSKRSSLLGKVSSTLEDRVLEKPRASLATSSATAESYHTMESLTMLQPLEHQVTPHNKRMLISEHADDFEEFNQSSPKKKRKKLSSFDGDGCKRCNCKKTKCLKLYCDCFAAGIYCAETCACQGCFNRPEYEDTVLETRQQIESRNPLAFAPKIVQHATEFPPINREDGGVFTPSSGRHKRGCNCKRSLCLKKYCECYQANVGCSAACRCEGCKNIYGKKGEYSMTEEIVRNKCIEERSDMVDDKLEMVASNTFLHADLYDLHNLTPPAPSYEHSSHGKGAPKSRLLPGRYVISSESDFSRRPPYAKSKISPSNPHSNALLTERSKETLDTVSFGQGIDYNLNETMGQFSPQFDEITDVSDLTPLPNSSSMTMASSASSKTQDKANVSQLQLYPRSGRLSSSGSLHWHSSPITPMTQLGETKNQAQDSDCRLYDILEDDTPEILKESPAITASVKVSSPNKKRVSPPHGHIQEFGSNSSGGLKSGRKFILKAVPSFPPLTPCVDSKDRTHQKC